MRLGHQASAIVAAAILSAALALLAPAGLPAASLEAAAAAAGRDGLAAAASDLGAILAPGAGQAPAVPLPEPQELPDGSVRLRFGGGLNVYFVNVGQGDSEFIELPDGKTALIDGGPVHPLDASGATPPPIAKFLAARGVSRIDHLVMTHPHADHYGGLPYVFDRLQVAGFYDTRMDNSSASGDELVRQRAARERGCKVSYPAEGDVLDWSAGVRVKVYNACPEAASSGPAGDLAADTINDCSIVLKVSYQGSSIIFTGDAGRNVEERMAAAYGGELRSTVLKVGHHGSAKSSSAPFLEAVRPGLAYIEVGENSYGHPHQPTLDRLNAVGARIYRTDLDGTLKYAAGDAGSGAEASASIAPSFQFRTSSLAR